MSQILANLIAKSFIARSDVKAIQKVQQDGKVIYMPHLDKSQNDPDAKRLPWTRPDLEAHIAGERTFGHYLLNPDDQCKLFVLDIDLAKSGILPRTPRPGTSEPGADPWADDKEIAAWEKNDFAQVDDLRTCWTTRSDPGRAWMKLQFKLIAHKLCKVIVEELELPCAVAYSGNKGVHVYGFTGLIPASKARNAAKVVLTESGCFELFRGDNFWRHTNQDYLSGFPNLEIETFPKQNSLDGKDLGNLVRLPLGRNLKNPKDPTFFIDMTTGLSDMKPLDPIWALTDGARNPWRKIGE